MPVVFKAPLLRHTNIFDVAGPEVFEVATSNPQSPKDRIPLQSLPANAREQDLIYRSLDPNSIVGEPYTYTQDAGAVPLYRLV